MIVISNMDLFTVLINYMYSLYFMIIFNTIFLDREEICCLRNGRLSELDPTNLATPGSNARHQATPDPAVAGQKVTTGAVLPTESV